jgi:hypothetical protein
MGVVEDLREERREAKFHARRLHGDPGEDEGAWRVHSQFAASITIHILRLLKKSKTPGVVLVLTLGILYTLNNLNVSTFES